MKDLVGKTIGTMVTFLFVMDGSLKTMNSAWSGPTGQLVRSLGKCFHPETKVKLQNGNIVSISEVNLGDILENGSVVESTMQISNANKTERIYLIDGPTKIYVTGSHLVFDKSQNKFIKVEKYSNAKLVDINIDWFSCLITSDHRITIGDEIFWDWEDHFFKK